ncbi:MAG TPA: hypothetical protein VFK04_13120 [Gemmatimonadaceae bacterium]|nr:hypothetical protein [Gemmatimonadaceae bacterium]
MRSVQARERSRAVCPREQQGDPRDGQLLAAVDGVKEIAKNWHMGTCSHCHYRDAIEGSVLCGKCEAVWGEEARQARMSAPSTRCAICADRGIGPDGLCDVCRHTWGTVEEHERIAKLSREGRIRWTWTPERGHVMEIIEHAEVA